MSSPRRHSKGGLDRSLLPNPLEFYSLELSSYKVNGLWAQAHCPFHNDQHPSFSFNVTTGYFHCFGCDATGGDVLDFVTLRYGYDFVSAAKMLNAWVK